MSGKDYSLNIPYLIREFKEAVTLIENDRETYKTPGIVGWKIRRDAIALMLIATGHRVDYETGKVEYIRNAV